MSRQNFNDTLGNGRVSNPSRILSSIALAPGSTELLVMSPLATMRWRQGQLQLSSPCHPKTLAIDCALAPTAMDRSAGLYRPERQAFAEAILESDDRYDIIL